MNAHIAPIDLRPNTLTANRIDGVAAPSNAFQDVNITSTTQVFESLLRSRRSVHAFTDRPVAQWDMEAILHAATLAPSSFNLQPYEFYWVRTPELRRQLKTMCLNQRPAVTAQELIVCVARWDRWRDTAAEHMVWLKSTAEVSPKSVAFHARVHKLFPIMFARGPFNLLGRLRTLAVAAIGLFRPILRLPESPEQLMTWATKSAALACDHMLLAARARGLDTCPLEGFDSVRVGQLLGLKGHWSIPMIVAVGHRHERGIYEPQWRRSPDHMLHIV